MCAMRVTDRLLAPIRGDIASVTRWCTGKGRSVDPFLADYLIEAFRLAPLVGLDASIVVAQSAHECFNPDTGKPWDSHWWRTRGNPAGLGITGDPADNAASKTWENGTDAARAQIVHIMAYAIRHNYSGTNAVWMIVNAFRDLDPRFRAVMESGWAGTVKTINDLAGKWATDTRYAEKIAAKGNAIWPALPDQEQDPPVVPITFGRVPLPPMQIRDVANSTAWNDLGPRTIRGVVWHRMLGTLMGTDSYFRTDAADRALTDYGIGVGQDGERDGVIFRWNDPRGRRAPWANGPVSAPYGDGKAFIDRYGVNASQRDLLSIEISGMQTTPLTEKSRRSIAHLTAYWADQYEVPWDQFPMVPNEGRSFVLWHEELTFGTGKKCPFEVVKGETAPLMDRARAIMKQHQTGTVLPPPPPTVDYPDHLDAGLMARMFGEVVGEDGIRYAYDEDGPVSTIWREQYGPHGWPALKAVWSYEDGARRFFIWEGGPPLFVGVGGNPIIVT